MATLRQQRLTQALAETDANAKAEQTAKAEYWITDPNMRNIGNVRLKPGQKSVVLTYGEARLFLGQGLDTMSPEERAKQREEAEAADAEHREKHAAEEAKRIEAAEHNRKKAESHQKGSSAAASGSEAKAEAKDPPKEPAAAGAPQKPKHPTAGR